MRTTHKNHDAFFFSRSFGVVFVFLLFFERERERREGRERERKEGERKREKKAIRERRKRERFPV